MALCRRFALGASVRPSDIFPYAARTNLVLFPDKPRKARGYSRSFRPLSAWELCPFLEMAVTSMGNERTLGNAFPFPRGHPLGLRLMAGKQRFLFPFPRLFILYAEEPLCCWDFSPCVCGCCASNRPLFCCRTAALSVWPFAGQTGNEKGPYPTWPAYLRLAGWAASCLLLIPGLYAYPFYRSYGFPIGRTGLRPSHSMLPPRPSL